MSHTRLSGHRRITWRAGAATALAAALAAALLQAGGQAQAAPRPAASHAQARAALASGDISTAAGGAGGPARATTVGLGYPGPCGVSFAGGNLYVADAYSVREVSPATGKLTTPAGTGLISPLRFGGLATAVSGLNTCGAVADGSGNLVIAVLAASRIVVVATSSGTFYGKAMTAGHIYSVAGDGQSGFAGNGTLATNAKLDAPEGVTVDSHGNVVIADTGNNRIRVVAGTTGTFYGQAMTAGHIYTVAGNGQAGYGGDHHAATSAEISLPYGVSVDSAGNLLVADTGNERIRVVAGTTGTFYGQTMTAKDIYTVAGNGQAGFAGDGGAATSAELDAPTSVVVDGAGNLVFTDATNGRVRVVATTSGTHYGQAMTAGDVYTVAGNGSGQYSGDGGPATSAGFYDPQGVTVDNSGNLAVADAQSGRVRVVATTSGSYYGQAMTAGDVYTVAGTGAQGTEYMFSGDGGTAKAAEFNAPQGVALDASGDTLITDTANERVRVVAALTRTVFGQAMKKGDIYTVAGDGSNGFTGDGGPGPSAWVSNPAEVVADAAGNLVIADAGNARIRVVAAHTGSYYGMPMTAGDIYTVAGDGTHGYTGDGGLATSAELSSAKGIAVDGAGNLVIADTFNDRIRVVAAKTGSYYGQAMTARHIYTIAGDGTLGYSGDGVPATTSALCEPYGLGTDAAGNVLIADYCNNRIVRVVAAATGTYYGQAMTAGDIYTIAGSGTLGYSGDGGPATGAALNLPQGVTVDSAGNVVLADTYNGRIRVVAAQTGTFYGVPMTTGDIYTVAGGAANGLGDGGLATKAELNAPQTVGVDGSGLLIADTLDKSIRFVAG